MRTESPLVFENLIRKRGRECTRCGGRHRDPKFKFCSVCRDLTAAWHKAYRHDHIARKLCPECIQKKGRVTKTCETHREYNNAHQRNEYADQRSKGLCVWGRCPVETEKVLCEKHEAKMAEYKARKARRTGIRWAA